MNYIDEDDFIEDRLSFILKVTDKHNKRVFICNRNSDDFAKLFSDKYLKWWGFKSLADLSMDDEEIEVKILEICEYSNLGGRDQRFLNCIKEDYIKKIGAIENDNDISNVLFNKSITNIRGGWKALFKYYEKIWNNLSTEEISNVCSKFWKLTSIDKRKKILNKNRNEIIELNGSDELKAILLFMKDYLLIRYNNRYPFLFKKSFKVINLHKFDNTFKPKEEWKKYEYTIEPLNLF